MGSILTSIVYLMQYLLQTHVDFPGHDIGICDMVFYLPVIASIAESTPSRAVLRIAPRLASRSSPQARSYAQSERWGRNGSLRCHRQTAGVPAQEVRHSIRNHVHGVAGRPFGPDGERALV